jgi:ankyrin repeat protein
MMITRRYRVRQLGGDDAVVKLLLEKGAEMESKDNDCGQTPLSLAAMEGHEAAVKLLLEKGAELESKDKDGRTPLSRAGENGHEAVVKLLLKKGAEMESKDKDGRTPLSRAVIDGREAAVKLLLENGAELVSKDDKYAQTPLSWGCRARARGGGEAWWFYSRFSSGAGLSARKNSPAVRNL